MKTEKKLQIVVLIIFIFNSLLLLGQENNITIPRDTSYSVHSSFMKYKKNYPDIVPVYFIENEKCNLHRDLVYADYGQRQLTLDLFLPDDNGQKSPLLLMVHGGGWISGDKKMTWPMASYLTKKGFACASVEYRMLLEASYPAALFDIKTAIRWLRCHADEYGIDTSFVAIYGGSAGGQIAALVAATGQKKLFTDSTLYPNCSDRVQALVDVDGVLHFLHPLSSETNSNKDKPTLATRWLGVHHTENIDRWNEASALSHVDWGMPPCLFVGSQYTRFLAGNEEFRAKLDSFGIYNQFHRFENCPHAFWLFEPWFSPTAEMVSTFLKYVYEKH